MISAISSHPARQQQVVERPANVQAQALTGRPYLSFSQISLMRACPRKFSLHYIEHASPDFIPASLIFGSAIHAAVEMHFRAILAGVATSAADLLLAYRLAWKGEKGQSGDGLPIQYPKDQDQAALEDLARRILAAFTASEASRPLGTPLGVEEELCVALAADLPDVLARVDLVYDAPDAVVVRDIKTSRSKWPPDKAEQSADQIVLYARVLEGIAQSMGKPARGEFVVLTKQKTPQVQVLPIAVTPDVVCRTQEAIASTWQAILAGNFYPAPSPMNCSTCQFRSRCPVYKP